jgi:diaminohydroxyphosphoribosylaminopyrimidine deaminase/5-amino-6-(5-phosphoribosylamino)uracil reductase
MERCLELAGKAIGYVAPNPMVGCVIVENGEIIGEGYHEKYGEAHAEVNAIKAVKEKYADYTRRLRDATLYVNLEPCSHHGKTPPCSDLIIQSGIKKVVIGCLDSNPPVAGKGIEKLRQAGVEVESGMQEAACRKLNKRFFTFHEKHRPYVILKWAQTADGFISKFPVPKDRKENMVSGIDAQQLTHIWRSQEQAIMVGTNTVRADDPELNVRLVEGENPVKVILDRKNSLQSPRLLNTEAKTIFFTEDIYMDAESGEKSPTYKNNIERIPAVFDGQLIPFVLTELYKRNFLSLLVEGGARLLQSFIDDKLFDEIRIFTSLQNFNEGVKAPHFFPRHANQELKVGNDMLRIFST